MKFEFEIGGKLLSCLGSPWLFLKPARLLLTAIAFLASGSQAHAAAIDDCEVYIFGLGTVSVQFPATITVPANAVAGTILASITVPVPGATGGKQIATCTGDSPATTNINWWINPASSIVANRVGTTSVAGIGYTSSLSGVTTGAPMVMDSSQAIGTKGEPKFASQVYVTVNLVATGTPIGTGALSLNPSGTGVVNTVGTFTIAGAKSGNMTSFVVAMAANATRITAPSCSVQNTTPSVTLAPVSKGLFSGVGSTAGSGSVAISLNCPTALSKVYVTLTDSVTPANRTSTLTPKSDSTASGVGLQILDPSGTPIKYGPDSATAGNTNQWLAGQSVTGSMNIPLSVRYIQTAATVTPGTVNGVATFTMSYQ